ncbi:MAG: pentapeptide repeat-containing protein, partial [Chloroflexota bacterium]
MGNLLQNFGSGIIGALVTYSLFDRIIQAREKEIDRQRSEEERSRLENTERLQKQLEEQRELRELNRRVRFLVSNTTSKSEIIVEMARNELISLANHGYLRGFEFERVDFSDSLFDPNYDYYNVWSDPFDPDKYEKRLRSMPNFIEELNYSKRKYQMLIPDGDAESSDYEHQYNLNKQKVSRGQTDFTNSILYRSKFVNCILNGAIFDKAELTYADFSGKTKLYSASFKEAQVVWVDFRGAN